MQVCVIDIETTGLNPQVHGITEFGAVMIDLFKPNQMKQFYRWLNPEGYVWSNYCLKLHHEWIGKIVSRQNKDGSFDKEGPEICRDIAQLNFEFRKWLFTECGVEVKDEHGNFDRLVGAGKNFGAFDLQFLLAKKFLDCFRHRSLDPGNLYMVKGDKVPPDLRLCKERAQAEGYGGFYSVEVTHDALSDAVDVAHLLWHKFDLDRKA